MRQILPLDPETYQRHRIHTQERDWAETNCYVDIWIEQLHAMGFEPVAAMAFTLAIDFEGDQWTFFKFPLSDLYALYGLDVQELAVWRGLTEHIEEQVGLGRPVLVELDSFYLPDTAGMAYQLAHVKSTVSVNEIDIDARHLGYFHGQGYYHLDGDDFASVFYLDSAPDPARLPPYVEIVKQRERPTADQAFEISKTLLRRQLSMAPQTNPFDTFLERFRIDFDWLRTRDLEVFHQYSFATLRQFGACYELAANYLQWLSRHGEPDLDEIVTSVKSISETAKIYQFQLARAMSRGRDLDLSPVENMREQWDAALISLKNRYL